MDRREAWSPTDIQRNLFGHEVKISSPIWLPESWKNAITKDMIDSFAKAFPYVDFSEISEKDLNGIGVQAMLRNPDPGEDNIGFQDHLPLLESMTQIVSTYAYLHKKNKPVSLKDLRHSGDRTGDPDIRKITRSLIDGLAHKLRNIDFYKEPGFREEQLTRDRIVELVAKGLFSGDLSEIRQEYELLYQKVTFNELLNPPTTNNGEGSQPDKQKSKINPHVVGMYLQDAGHNAIVFTVSGNVLTNVWKPAVDILAKFMPKEYSLVYPDGEYDNAREAYRAWQIMIRLPKTHEFTHFLTFQKWLNNDNGKNDFIS